jgi:hypothetical protein
MAASTLTWEREVLDKVLYTLTKELEVDAAAQTHRGRRMLHNCCFLEKSPESAIKLLYIEVAVIMQLFKFYNCMHTKGVATNLYLYHNSFC